MITITILNMKGGVGKTTISVGLSYELAASFGKKVLLIDMDAQTNATLIILNEENYSELDKNEKTIADIISYSEGLMGEKKISVDDIIIKNPWNISTGELDLIPSSIRLFSTKRVLDKMSFSEKLIKNEITEKVINNYDYCIIDSPPDFDKLVISALYASDKYLVPVKPDYLSQQGLFVLDRLLKAHDSNLRSDKLGYIMSLIPTRKGAYYERMIQELEEYCGDNLLTKIMTAQSYNEWPETHKPLKKKWRSPFIELAKKVVERCEK